MRKAATRSSSSPELATRAAPPPPDMSDTAPLGVDDALERAGGWSTFQWRLMGALGACTSSAATHMLQPIFLVPLMDWPDVSSVQVGLTSSLFFAGYAVGVFAWAAYSDGRGRRPTILASFLVGNLGGIGSFFAPTFHTFLALRCLCGFGVGGLKNAVFLLGTEFAPPAARAQVIAAQCRAAIHPHSTAARCPSLISHHHLRARRSARSCPTSGCAACSGSSAAPICCRTGRGGGWASRTSPRS